MCDVIGLEIQKEYCHFSKSIEVMSLFSDPSYFSIPSFLMNSTTPPKSYNTPE
jgi:hypothetical protein